MTHERTVRTEPETFLKLSGQVHVTFILIVGLAFRFTVYSHTTVLMCSHPLAVRASAHASCPCSTVHFDTQTCVAQSTR